MHNITDQQIEFILEDIAKKGIVTEDVRYNILDHVCCIIENEMPSEMNFYEFYENTIARFYKKELQEIEEETRQLTTFKYYHAMKRTVKIAGLASVLMILIGSILKVQHLPGAGISLVAGFAFFSFFFIPLNIIMKFRDDKEKYNRIVMTLGLTLVLTGTIGLLFKVMHWPYANILFFGSLAVFGLIFIPIYFFTNYRRPETKFNAIIHTTFMIAAAGMLFTLINLRPSKNITESVESTATFQDQNISDFKVKNATLYGELKDGPLKKTDDLKTATAIIVNKLDAIKCNLIAKSENISLTEAEQMSLSDLSNPNDVKVVNTQFFNSQDEYSYSQLLSAIDFYNSQVSSIDNEGIMRKLNILDLKMENTVLSVVLMNLADIKIQILANENSFLCFQKGFLADK